MPMNDVIDIQMALAEIGFSSRDKPLGVVELSCTSQSYNAGEGKKQYLLNRFNLLCIL